MEVQIMLFSRVLAATVLVVVSVTGSEAGTKKFTLTRGDLSVFSANAVFDPYGGTASMNGTDLSNLNFVVPLPGNYLKNSPVTLKLKMSTSDAGCGIVLSPFEVRRARSGSVKVSGVGGAAGLSHIKGDAFQAPATSERVFTRSFKLKPAPTGAITSQIAGDVITVNIQRSPSNAADTCSILTIHAVDVIYKTP